ncbi:LuxR family transcriptional regulator [Pseudorhodobacter sp. E13]|uniref:helix-turn-helix transcriptional regulator n=1 Tax=Pseudorhodobacter sp. E13 TaxID=2487931 RepID=UPI001F40D7A5|nr:LuxR family transcriptional regulator [Pseudorhodobacter sp. E13]
MKTPAPLKLLNAIALSNKTEEIWAMVGAYMAPLGFSRLNYGLTRFRFENSIGDPEDALYLSTQSTEYMTEFFTKGHFARTPVFRWVMTHTGTCNWRWIEEARAAGTLSPAELEALEVNDRLGVKAGIAISFPETSNRIKGAIGMIADKGLGHDDVDAIWADQGDAISAVAHMMHLKIASLPMRSPKRALTNRQREALEWVADGKTMQDTAILMGVSAAMVEKHLRLAREALDVETTTQAVAKATLLNVIFTRGGLD